MNSHIIQLSSNLLNNNNIINNNNTINTINNITNNGKVQMSFIDETRQVVMKHKVTKRNHSLNLKQSRLRKPLQNDKFLLNYFEFNSEQQQQSNNSSSCSTLNNNNLTMYKIINTNKHNKHNKNNYSSNYIPNEEISNNYSDNKIGKSKNGRRKLSMDTIITKQQVKVKSSPLIDYNSRSRSSDSSSDDELFFNNYNKSNDDFKQEQEYNNQYDSNNYWDLFILELEQDLVDNSLH